MKNEREFVISLIFMAAFGAIVYFYHHHAEADKQLLDNPDCRVKTVAEKLSPNHHYRAIVDETPCADSLYRVRILDRSNREINRLELAQCCLDFYKNDLPEANRFRWRNNHTLIACRQINLNVHYPRYTCSE